MIEIFKEAKKNKEILYFENFQTPEITWQDALNFIYNQSAIENRELENDNSWGGARHVWGNIVSFNGYLYLRENNLFKHFKGVKELMEKVNDGNSGINCSYYESKVNKKSNYICNCGAYWHLQALRFVMSEYTVSDHNDPNDVLYWQLIGESHWKMNNDKIYTLKPGDLFYFNQEDSHEVFQDGPRAGIIIDGKKS